MILVYIDRKNNSIVPLLIKNPMIIFYAIEKRRKDCFFFHSFSQLIFKKYFGKRIKFTPQLYAYICSENCFTLTETNKNLYQSYHIRISVRFVFYFSVSFQIQSLNNTWKICILMMVIMNELSNLIDCSNSVKKHQRKNQLYNIIHR